jgi:hypothetical protein
MVLKESRLMTGYGAPAGGPPVAAAKTQPPLFDMIAAGLGVVTFILGFFDWYGVSSAGTKGLAIGGAAVVGLSLLASLAASAKFVEAKAEPGLVPPAASVSAVLVAFGMLVSKPEGQDAKPGLIIALIVTLVQAALFVVSWLQASGRMGGSASTGGAASTQWGAPQQYGQSTYAGSPSYGAHGGQPAAPAPPGYGQSGYGQQQPSPSGGYSQPQHGAYPAAPPPAAPPPTGYGTPSTGYGAPSSPPASPPPTGTSAPSGPPPSGGYPQPGSGGYGQG